MAGDLDVSLYGPFELNYNMNFEILDVEGVLDGQFNGLGEVGTEFDILKACGFYALG